MYEVCEVALSDVKVLDLTHYIAGPYCTKLLADYGAEVVKIEKPGQGDGARRLGPFFNDDPHPEKSGLFLYLNTNKKGITLNLKSDTGKKMFKELVEDADILVENFEPRVMPSLGLSYDTLRGVNPGLIMTSISNFGQSGPYRDFKASEIILYAMGHSMHCSGMLDREPLKMWNYEYQFYSGTLAAVATMVALFGSRTQGTGDHIDAAIIEAELGSVDRGTYLLSYQYTGQKARREESLGWALPYPVGIAKDGFFDVISLPGRDYFARVCKTMGRPDLIDSKYGTMEAMMTPALRDEFEAIWMSWSTQRSKQEVFLKGQENKVLVGPRNTIEDVANDPHLGERGQWVEIDHPVVGKLKYPGAPFKGEMPWQIRRPAPLLGQHNEEVYSQLGLSKEDLVRLSERGVI